MYILFKEMSVLNWVNFYLKSVNFLFLFSICCFCSEGFPLRLGA